MNYVGNHLSLSFPPFLPNTQKVIYSIVRVRHVDIIIQRYIETRSPRFQIIIHLGMSLQSRRRWAMVPCRVRNMRPGGDLHGRSSGAGESGGARGRICSGRSTAGRRGGQRWALGGGEEGQSSHPARGFVAGRCQYMHHAAILSQLT